MSEIPLPSEEYMGLVSGAAAPDLAGRFLKIGSQITEFLQKEGMLGPHIRFLDIGCGCGRVARFLVNKPLAAYTGFDRHPGMISWCQKEIEPRHPRFKFHCFRICSSYDTTDKQFGDIPLSEFYFPYESSSFDAIFLGSVFTHMPLSDIEHYLKEIRRVINPYGKCLASVFFNKGGDKTTGDHMNFYLPRSAFLRVLEATGFKFKERSPWGLHNWFLMTPS